jgi:hypothetical protein
MKNILAALVIRIAIAHPVAIHFLPLLSASVFVIINTYHPHPAF